MAQSNCQQRQEGLRRKAGDSAGLLTYLQSNTSGNGTRRGSILLTNRLGYMESTLLSPVVTEFVQLMQTAA